MYAMYELNINRDLISLDSSGYRVTIYINLIMLYGTLSSDLETTHTIELFNVTCYYIFHTFVMEKDIRNVERKLI